MKPSRGTARGCPSELVKGVSSVGRPILRREDWRLLRGEGRFSADFEHPGQLYAAFARSPVAHARLGPIDLEAALAMRGVVAAYSGEDCARDGVGALDHNPIPSTRHDLALSGPHGSQIQVGPHALLPRDKLRHVGEAYAMVVAHSPDGAAEAAEKIVAQLDVLPPVLGIGPPTTTGQAPVWDESPDNCCVDTWFGEPEAVKRALDDAAVVIEESFHIDRVSGVPLEPRAALAIVESVGGACTLVAGSGGAVRQRGEVAAALGIEPQMLRVISPDVGGNFGTRNRVYVEFPLLVWAARKLGRPIKYVSSRSEAFLSDYQGRDLTTHLRLGVSDSGKLLALEAHNISNVGARVVSLSPLAKGAALVTGSYDIGLASVRAEARFTTTVPTQAYRSSGRPEVTYAIERMIERAAAALGMSSVELRQRNLVPAAAMPYDNPLGMRYDSGDYPYCLDHALAMGDWNGFPERRTAGGGPAAGIARGIGVAHYVESSTGAPVEAAEVTITAERRVSVATGTQPSGQGHQTSFAQVAADVLEVDWAQIDVVLGDTDVISVGGGSHSGRSMRMAGTVITMACEAVIQSGYTRAAEQLEVPRGDLTYAAGEYRVAGTDRAVGLFDLVGEGFSEARVNEMHRQVFPNGCHVCEVEVDIETGAVRVLRYTAVDDVGVAINPMIVEGQTHGGVVQGLGQALRERCVVDAQSGQPLTGSLLDYGLLRADDLPMIDAHVQQFPSPTNPLGVKAGGEGGTTPALAALTNAVLDALAPYGVRDLTMPLTPERVWRALRASDDPKGANR